MKKKALQKRSKKSENGKEMKEIFLEYMSKTRRGKRGNILSSFSFIEKGKRNDLKKSKRKGKDGRECLLQ